MIDKLKTNDLRKGINTIKYVRKYLVAAHERTNPGNMQISLFSIMQRADKSFSREVFLRNISEEVFLKQMIYLHLQRQH